MPASGAATSTSAAIADGSPRQRQSRLAVANVEVDFYAGIKPVLGPVTFDLGVIHYAYLGGHDKGPRFPRSASRTSRS